ncbi:MAG: hypothetical protein N2446_00680 [Elusimicrobiales bacterium]|nr:hypothetical protein [Elusimicrobiales bacterium]
MKHYFIIFFLVFFSVQSLFCEKIGFGIILGLPSGINIRNMLNEKDLFSAILSWKVGGDREFTMSVDRLFNEKRYYEKKGYNPEPYFLFLGFGGEIKFDDGTDLYVRLPLGIKKDYRNIEIFLQVTPKLKLTEETKGDLDFSVGAVYYFK